MARLKESTEWQKFWSREQRLVMGVRSVKRTGDYWGSGFVFEGLNHTSYKVEYTANPDCMSHFTYESVTELARKSSDWTLEDLRRRGVEDLDAPDVVVEFTRDIVRELECPACGAKEEIFAPVGSIKYEQGRCPRDGEMRVVKTIHSYDGSEDFGKRSLDKLGLPLF